MSRLRPTLVKPGLKCPEFAVDRLAAALYLVKRLGVFLFARVPRRQVGDCLRDEAVERTRDANQARKELREFGRAVFGHYAATFSHDDEEVKE